MDITLTPECSAQIDLAVTQLRAGGLVGMPTETVYGLAADASNADAVAQIFALKGRPNDHPVIVHVADSSQLVHWAARVPDAAWQLAQAFWPGPLTFILPRHPSVKDAVTGGQDTVGLRAPNHPVALELLRRFGGGLAAPSANRFGHVSPTTAAHVQAEFGAALPLVLDGGPCVIGVESTIVGLVDAKPTLLRPGGIAAEAIEDLLGCKLQHHQSTASAKLRVSGLLDSHYAPRTPLLVGTLAQVQDEAEARAGARVAILQWSPIAAASTAAYQHAMPARAEHYAQLLYATLRQLDHGQFDVLLLELPPQTPEWLAVNDRLRRAASAHLS